MCSRDLKPPRPVQRTRRISLGISEKTDRLAFWIGSKKSKQKIPTKLCFHTKLSPSGNYTWMIYGVWVFSCPTHCRADKNNNNAELIPLGSQQVNKELCLYIILLGRSPRWRWNVAFLRCWVWARRIINYKDNVSFVSLQSSNCNHNYSHWEIYILF